MFLYCISQTQSHWHTLSLTHASTHPLTTLFIYTRHCFPSRFNCIPATEPLCSSNKCYTVHYYICYTLLNIQSISARNLAVLYLIYAFISTMLPCRTIPTMPHVAFNCDWYTPFFLHTNITSVLGFQLPLLYQMLIICYCTPFAQASETYLTEIGVFSGPYYLLLSLSCSFLSYILHATHGSSL